MIKAIWHLNFDNMYIYVYFFICKNGKVYANWITFFRRRDNESNYVYKYLEPVLAVFMADPLILMQM